MNEEIARKEELKQEAEEWIAKNSKEFITNPNYSPFDYAEAIYLAGAEPREKQIQIDTEQIRALQKQNGELTDKVKELEKELKYAEENCLFRDCPKVERLEKENAELKDKADKCQHLADVRLEQELETYQKSYTVSREKLDTEIALDEVKDQLTKAKIYLKYFVNILKKLRASKEPLVIEVDQFLKDSEVEK